jgi:hypothetical protein
MAPPGTALPPRAVALLGAGLVASVLVLILVLTLPRVTSAPAPETTAKAKAPPANAPPANAPAKVRMLQRGDRKPAVADLQAALGALGFYSAPVDGVFGDGTAAAVASFQQSRGLVADGVVGPTTKAALVAAISEVVASDAELVRDGLVNAAAEGRISRASADRYVSLVDDLLAQLESMQPGRIATLALVVRGVADNAAVYDEPRTLTLLGMLKANADFLSEHPVSPEHADITDADGIVYRFFQDRGYQFHPIAAFARLNKLAKDGRRDEVRRLADALAARGIPSGRALLWEYFFPFGGPTNWASGFAQATAAQAFGRSSKLLGDERLAAHARAAYLGIFRRLSMELGGGLWVREYGFSDMPILNAQLQSLVSLHEYVDTTRDLDAATTVERMTVATKALLAQFDTGCWSLYSLGGSSASLHYHSYHVRLLKQLAAVTGDPLWTTTAARWQGYLQSGGGGAC